MQRIRAAGQRVRVGDATVWYLPHGAPPEALREALPAPRVAYRASAREPEDYAFVIERKKVLAYGAWAEEGDFMVVTRLAAASLAAVALAGEFLRRQAEALRYAYACFEGDVPRPVRERLAGFRAGGRCGLTYVTHHAVRAVAANIERFTAATGRKLLPSVSGIKAPARQRKALERRVQAERNALLRAYVDRSAFPRHKISRNSDSNDD